MLVIFFLQNYEKKNALGWQNVYYINIKKKPNSKFKIFHFPIVIIELTRCALGAPRGPLWVTRSTAVKCLGGRGEWNSTLENNRIEFWSKSVMLSTLHFAYHRLPSKIQVSGTQRKLHTIFFLASSKQRRQYFFGLKDIENILSATRATVRVAYDT